MTPSNTASDPAATWLHPDQIQRLRTACYQGCFQSDLQRRNDVLITLLYDTGLRVGELVTLSVDQLDLETRSVRLPNEHQFERAQPIPTEQEPLTLDPGHSLGTVRLLVSYLSDRDSDTTVLFPSRKGGHLTPKAVRDVVSTAAEAIDIRPYTPAGRGEATDVSPQTLRHSTAWRLLNVENRSLSAVRDRLRHTALSTTRSLYADFDPAVTRSPNRCQRRRDSTRSNVPMNDNILDAIPDILYAFDRDGRMIWWNERVSAVTGYSDEEIAAVDPLTFIAREDRAEIAKVVAEVFENGSIERREIHLVTKDNDYLPYEFTGAPISESGNTITGIAGVGRDIAARKRFERISDGFYALDTDWQFTYLNSKAERLVGRREADLLGAVIWDELPELVGTEIHDEFHRTMRTQNPASFEQYLPGQDAWFSIRIYPSKTGLSVYFRDITDRKERERELERRRIELTQLNQFNVLVQNLVSSVLGESTSTEIKQTVCNQLAASDFYLAAWIGELTRTTETLTPEVGAGVDPEDVPSVATVTGDGGSPPGIVTRAVEHRVACVTHDLADEPTAPTCLEQLLSETPESALAVPIQYGDVMYGILVVYSTQLAAFREPQREGFVALGETIGFALTAAERKDVLVAENVLELTLSIQDPSQLFVRIATQFDATVTLEGTTSRGDDAYLEYLSVTGATAEDVRELVEQSNMTDHVRVVNSHGTECLCEVGVTDSSIVSTVAEYGGTVTGMTADSGRGAVRIELPSTTEIGRVTDALRETGVDVELQAKRTLDRPLRTDRRIRSLVVDSLTDKQRSVLEAAYFGGFFEQPRHSTGEEIAESMGISPSTFHQHLRVGLAKVVTRIVSPPDEDE